MVERSNVALDRVFHALSDATRRAMLQALVHAAPSISELAAPHAMSFAAASKHVRVLEEAGLLEREVAGRVHRCRLSPEPLARASAFLSRYAEFWSERLDALEAVLDAEAKAEARSRARAGAAKKSARAGTRARRTPR